MQPVKKLSVILLTVLVYAMLYSCSSSSKASQAWVSSEYKKSSYTKIMVLAKISDDAARKQLEDATVNALKAKGYTAVTAYMHVTADDLTSEEKFIRKIQSEQVDALIVFDKPSTTAEYKNMPQVSAGVGVPVRVGFFNVFLGGSVPIAGGVKQEQVINLKSSFYNKDSRMPFWALDLNGKLNKGTASLAEEFAGKVVSSLISSNIL